MENIFSSFIWRYAERFGAQFITLVVSIVLARLIAPEAYGTIALIQVVIAIMQVFVDSGMGNALIQKLDADDGDFSTVFIFNIFLCVVVYLVVFFLSPVIARFYNDLSMIPVIRVLGITILISGVKNIQQAYVSRQMLFKKFFFATLFGTLLSAVVGIAMAYAGFGIWAIVGQHLTNTIVDTIVLWFTVKWRPKLYFSLEKFKRLYGFGWKMLVSALLDTGYNNLRSLVIGKMYTKADLAYYDRGKQIPNIIVSNVNSSIGSVLFPALAKEQNFKGAVKAHVRKGIRVSSYVMWPMLMGIAACAEPIIRILLTDTWLPAVPFVQIACLTYGFWPIYTTNLQAITAMGRSDIFLKLEVIKKVLGIIILLVSMRYGVLAIALFGILSSIISIFVNSWPNKKLLDYSTKELFSDFMPSFLLALFMGLVVYQLTKLNLSPVLLLLLQIPTGIAIYWIGSILLKFEMYDFVKAYAYKVIDKIRC